jgi:hypothetical protein
MSDKFEMSKKGQRKISEFTAQEMLYDYISHKLDSERMEAIENLVKSSREIQDEIHALNKALSYAEHLSQTQVSQKTIDSIKTPKTYIQGFFQKIKWSEWPEGLKLGIEVFVVASLIVLVVISIPWNKVLKYQFWESSQEIITEVQKDFNNALKSEIDLAEKNAAPAELIYQDDNFKATEANLQVTQVDKKIENSIKKPVESVTTKPVETQNPVKVEVTKKSEKSSEPTKGQGFLYRGNIKVSNLDTTTEKFVEKIQEFGGRKAGEVPLGWKKGESTYFHFTIPEAKYEALEGILKEYGKIEMTKEKHERIMPDGIIRLIINVYEDRKQ